jgi:hypothetical protein
MAREHIEPSHLNRPPSDRILLAHYNGSCAAR